MTRNEANCTVPHRAARLQPRTPETGIRGCSRPSQSRRIADGLRGTVRL